VLLHACIFAPRERVRNAARAALARRHWRLTMSRRPERFAALLRASLVDLALVDLASPGAADAASLARDLPMVPFLGCAPFGVADTAVLWRAVESGFSDVLAEGIDEGTLGPLAAQLAFSRRFAAVMWEPPSALRLSGDLQLSAWRAIVAGAGRPLSTQGVAARCAVTREHLSRTFAADDGPTLKEAIDLVRLLAAAQLTKCPAYDLSDVARLLGFRSASTLSRMARRMLGRGASSLARLRGDDVVGLWARTAGVPTSLPQAT
jgi:AraC-like DNA-binding protein